MLRHSFYFYLRTLCPLVHVIFQIAPSAPAERDRTFTAQDRHAPWSARHSLSRAGYSYWVLLQFDLILPLLLLAIHLAEAVSLYPGRRQPRALSVSLYLCTMVQLDASSVPSILRSMEWLLALVARPAKRL